MFLQTGKLLLDKIARLVESLGQLSVECGEERGDTFRERGYSEGEKYSRERERGFFRRFRLGEGRLNRDSETDMAVGTEID